MPVTQWAPIQEMYRVAEWVHQAAIHKTALILVEAFLGDEYHYSKLYDAGFSHEYRQA
jgi:precorrin-4/cobalt-precorrin-4 C11-methyltransferase